MQQGDGTIASRRGAITAADLEQTSDEEAIQRVLAGDGDAFAVLVERYQGRAFRLAPCSKPYGGVRILFALELEQDHGSDDQYAACHL